MELEVGGRVELLLHMNLYTNGQRTFHPHQKLDTADVKLMHSATRKL